MINTNIEEQIKSYEPLMHRVLNNRNVKKDYEDLLQEMRIVVWRILTDTNPKSVYLGVRNAKFSSFLYKTMSNRLTDLFRTTYKRETNDKDKDKTESVEQVRKKSLNRPKLFEDMSFEQQVNTLQDCHDADSIRLKTDIETFYTILNDFERKLWGLKVEGWTQTEISKKLKEQGFNKTQSTISRKLKIINNKFLKFIENGEL